MTYPVGCLLGVSAFAAALVWVGERFVRWVVGRR